MTARVDLHSHSHFSDGVLSVEALCQQAERSGLDYLAISDHDTVDAHKHLQMSPYTGRLRIIPAVEI